MGSNGRKLIEEKYNSELISTTDIFTWVVYENIAYPESLVEDYQTILNNTTEIKMPDCIAVTMACRWVSS